MSRIHDALRRAEQDRIASAAVEGAVRPVEVVEIEVVPSEASPRLAMGSIAERPVPLTLDLLRARCQQHRWNPDPKRILGFSSQNHTLGAEEFRTLRSRLYQVRDKQPLRTVLVTSALPGEGKTFVAANLAQAIARQHERRAILIDSDLRRSQLHLSLGTASTPGLTEYLRGEADEWAVMQRGPADNLFFIPGGTAVTNPAELLANGRLKNLLERLAPIFDWIILDSPPTILVADASLVADMCDGVLMVVEAAVTPFDLAKKARDGFREKRLLGVVLNRAEPGSAYSSYYHKGYYAKAPVSRDGVNQERSGKVAD